jgi:hypothetical protein
MKQKKGWHYFQILLGKIVLLSEILCFWNVLLMQISPGAVVSVVLYCSLTAGYMPSYRSTIATTRDLVVTYHSVLRIRIRKDPHHLGGSGSGILDAGSGS